MAVAADSVPGAGCQSDLAPVDAPLGAVPLPTVPSVR